jgi:VWFA-related protein
MQRMLNEEIAAIRLLAARLLQEKTRKNEACLLGFSQRVVLWQDFTSAPLVFLSALSRLRSESEDGETRMFDAISLVAPLLKARAGRKAIVLVSDCVDTSSQARVEDAIAAAQRADVGLYAVRLLDPDLVPSILGDDHLIAQSEIKELRQRVEHDIDQAWTVMQMACEATGGRAASTFAEIEEELDNQYSLGFNATPETDKPGAHKMRITSTTPGFTVRSKDTYYL